MVALPGWVREWARHALKCSHEPRRVDMFSSLLEPLLDQPTTPLPPSLDPFTDENLVNFVKTSILALVIVVLCSIYLCSSRDSGDGKKGSSIFHDIYLSSSCTRVAITAKPIEDAPPSKSPKRRIVMREPVQVPQFGVHSTLGTSMTQLSDEDAEFTPRAHSTPKAGSRLSTCPSSLLSYTCPTTSVQSSPLSTAKHAREGHEPGQKLSERMIEMPDEVKKEKLSETSSLQKTQTATSTSSVHKDNYYKHKSSSSRGSSLNSTQSSTSNWSLIDKDEEKEPEKEKEQAKEESEKEETKKSEKEKEEEDWEKVEHADVIKEERQAAGTDFIDHWEAGLSDSNRLSQQTYDVVPACTEFRWSDASAESVFITGSFVDWMGKIPLEREEEGGWRVRLPLPQGTHHYLYAVDGKWATDQSKPLTNELGSVTHNVLHIPS